MLKKKILSTEKTSLRFLKISKLVSFSKLKTSRSFAVKFNQQ